MTGGGEGAGNGGRARVRFGQLMLFFLTIFAFASYYVAWKKWVIGWLGLPNELESMALNAAALCIGFAAWFGAAILAGKPGLGNGIWVTLVWGAALMVIVAHFVYGVANSLGWTDWEPPLMPGYNCSVDAERGVCACTNSREPGAQGTCGRYDCCYRSMKTDWMHRVDVTCLCSNRPSYRKNMECSDLGYPYERVRWCP